MANTITRALRRPVAAPVVLTCLGSLNAERPCQHEASVVQVHRHKINRTDTVDVEVRLCNVHARRLRVGAVVRGVRILSQRDL